MKTHLYWENGGLNNNVFCTMEDDNYEEFNLQNNVISWIAHFSSLLL